MSVLNSRSSAAELERAAEQSRERIEQIAAHLGERMTPSHLVDEAVSAVRSNGGDAWMKGLSKTASRHPLPLAVAGLAAGYVAHLARKEVDDRDGLPKSAAASDPSPAVVTDNHVDRHHQADPNEANGLPGSIDELKQRGAEAATDVRESASRIVRDVKDGEFDLERIVKDHPLLVGAVSLGVGALLATQLPNTRAEDRVIGPASDNVSNRIRREVESGISEAQNYAEGYLQTLKTRLDEAAPFVSTDKN